VAAPEASLRRLPRPRTQGEVIIVKKDDINHFQWRSRDMPYEVDPALDHTVFPGDATFEKTGTGREGWGRRVG